jgi:predicted RNA-binding Zn-ribbon protein involved in translation (DUF1610 family)
MKDVLCPECGGPNIRHLTDAYILRYPFVNEDGSLELRDCDTLEYGAFFECPDCGHRPDGAELLFRAS